jgi:hypothetical protein
LAGFERAEKIRRLRVEAGFVEVDETLYRVRPLQAAIARLEERVCMADGVDDDIGWLVRIVHLFQSRVEFFDEAEIHLFAGAMQREVQARRTNQVEIGVVVPGADYAADGNIRDVQLFEAA